MEHKQCKDEHSAMKEPGENSHLWLVMLTDERSDFAQIVVHVIYIKSNNRFAWKKSTSQ